MFQKPTWRERLNYRFDNTLSHGPQVLIGWLGIAALILVILATAIPLVIPGVAPSGNGVSEQHDASKSYAVHTNPHKSNQVTFSVQDKVIVLVEE
jgi:hypothetical protein